jgi:hypothetical protein
MTEMRPPGKTSEMTVLLVDDRDGRVLAEIASAEDVQRVLAGWADDDGSVPDYLCLVELRSHQGGILGADSSVKIRVLQEG